MFFLKNITDESEVEQMNDSLPLFIYENKVYVLRSECVERFSGGGNAERLNGGGSTERNSGSGNAVRLSGGGSAGRNSGSDNTERLSGGGISVRNSGGGNAERLNGAGNTERNSGGGSVGFSCSLDGGRLFIAVPDARISKKSKIYYQHRFYTTKDKFFTIK